MNIADFPAGLQTLLDNFVTQLELLDVDVPPARYVAQGIVPWDGPGLTLYLGEIAQGQPGSTFEGTFVTAVATNLQTTVYVQLLREVPGLGIGGNAEVMTPDADELGYAGMVAMADAAALVRAAIAIHQEYLSTGPGEGFSIGPAQPLGPEGGIGGMRITLRLSLG